MKNKNFENAFDALLGFFASLPKSTLKMINPNKYVLMLKTASDLANLLKENTESGEVNIEVDETFNSGYVSVQLEYLIIESPTVYANIIKNADNFEICPLTNGNIQLDLTFHSVLKSIS